MNNADFEKKVNDNVVLDVVYYLSRTSDPPRLRSSDKHIIGTNMFCLL